MAHKIQKMKTAYGDTVTLGIVQTAHGDYLTIQGRRAIPYGVREWLDASDSGTRAWFYASDVDVLIERLTEMRQEMQDKEPDHA